MNYSIEQPTLERPPVIISQRQGIRGSLLRSKVLGENVNGHKQTWSVVNTILITAFATLFGFVLNGMSENISEIRLQVEKLRGEVSHVKSEQDKERGAREEREKYLRWNRSVGKDDGD